MKHPLEIENEELEKRIEDTYSEIAEVEYEISRYAIMEMTEQLVKNTSLGKSTNSILMNGTTLTDITKYWGNNK